MSGNLAYRVMPLSRNGWDNMTITQFLDVIALVIPIVGFIAAGVAMIIFVKYKGTIDALREAANTYETLAASYKETNEALQQQILDLKKQVDELQKTIEVQKTALQIALDETFASLRRYGVCLKSDECISFDPPTIKNLGGK